MWLRAMRRFYCELGPSAGRAAQLLGEESRIASLHSTDYPHAIQRRRNQEPTRARLWGPNEPEITQMKKEVQD